MARVEFAPEVVDDVDRILAHLSQYAPTDAPARIAGILHAIDALTYNPLIGDRSQTATANLSWDASQVDMSLCTNT
ncbi:MAG: hypothetical protein V4693_20260 [Pseudomonadota bacterium]